MQGGNPDVVLVSIHASHAGGDGKAAPILATTSVSIHASHAGGDVQSPIKRQWTPVSIHASHAGGDSLAGSLPCRFYSFNPRLPCGRRLQNMVLLTQIHP